MVLAGAMDGKVRAYDIANGEVLWMLDTTATFATVANGETHGGSMGGSAGPVAFDGRVYISSGYDLYNHMAGNLLLALTPLP